MKQSDKDHVKWADVATVPTVPTLKIERAHQQVVTILGEACVELPYSGWGALVGWLSDVHRMFRTPSEPPSAPPNSAGHHARTDRDEIDDEIDCYLAEANVPARPRGYRWFLKLPRGASAQMFWSALMEGISARGLTSHDPGVWKDALADLLNEIHSDTR